MRFALEPLTDNLIAEMRPLWDDHQLEVPLLNLPIEPDLSSYKRSAENGMLRIYTARLGGEAGAENTSLEGYQVFYVIRHPHRKYSLEASMDLLYLDPYCRQGFTAIKFMKWCWAQLKKEGVKVIHQQIAAENNFGRIFERYGFKLMDLTYSLRCS